MLIQFAYIRHWNVTLDSPQMKGILTSPFVLPLQGSSRCAKEKWVWAVGTNTY